MNKVLASPVELGFSEFVSKLISDTFDAIMTSQLEQEENWEKLSELMSLDIADFANQVIDEEMVNDELEKLFPKADGGTSIVMGTAYRRGNPRTGIPEEPPVRSLLNYQPRGRTLSAKDVSEINSIVRRQIAQKKYELLGHMFSKGKTKVVVDTGKINAKLNFEMLQVEDETDTSSPNEISSARRVLLSRRMTNLRSISKSKALKNIHLFVKPPTDKDPQTHQIKANVYGEVEITFKTIS